MKTRKEIKAEIILLQKERKSLRRMPITEESHIDVMDVRAKISVLLWVLE